MTYESIAGSRAGFSLIELAVALAIITVLAAVVIPMAGTMIEDSKINAAKEETKTIAEAVGRYRIDVGKYPPGPQNNPNYNYQRGGQGASALNKWLIEGNKRYLAKKIENDPWGRPYNYHIYVDNSGYMDVVIYSLGPDGQDSSWNGNLWRKGEFAGDDIGSFFDMK